MPRRARALPALLPALLVASALALPGATSVAQPVLTTVAVREAQPVLGATQVGAARAGQPVTYAVTLTNLGGTPTTQPFELGVDSARVHEAEGDGWSCAPTPAEHPRCRYDAALAPGATAPVLTVRQQTTPTDTQDELDVSMVTEGGQPDNRVALTTPLVPASGSDLALSLAPDGLVPAGSAAAFRLVLSELGAQAASAPAVVRLRPLASGVVPLGTGTGWSCEAGTGMSVCRRTDVLAPGAHVDLGVLLPPVPVRAGSPPAQGVEAVLLGTESPRTGNDVAIAAVDASRDSDDDRSLAVAADGAAPGVYRVRVRNVGTRAFAAPTVLQLSAPDGSTPTAAGGPAWFCESARCTHQGELAAGAEIPVLVVSSPAYRIGVTLLDGNRATGTAVADSEGAGLARPIDPQGGLRSRLDAEPVGPVGAARAVLSVQGPVTGEVPGPVQVSARAGAPSTDLGTSATGVGWQCSQDGVCTWPGTVVAGEVLPPLELMTRQELLVRPGHVRWTAGPAGGEVEAMATVGLPQAQRVVVPGSVRATGPGSFTGTLEVRNPSGVDAPAAQVQLVALASGPQPALGVIAEASGEGWVCAQDRCRTAGPVLALSALPPLTYSGTGPPGRTVQVGVRLAEVDGSGSRGQDFTELAQAAVGLPVSEDRRFALRLDVPGPVLTDLTAEARVTVRNDGAGTARSGLLVNLTGTTTATPLEDVSGSGAGWSCVAAWCRNDGAVPPGEELPPLSVRFRVPSGWSYGPLQLTGTVQAPGPDGGRGPTLATSSTTVPLLRFGGPGRVALRLSSDGLGRSTPGGRAVVHVGLRNPGSQDVVAPELDLAPTAGLTVQSATGDGWACTGLRCRLAGTIVPGEISALAVTATVATNAPATVGLGASADWLLPTARSSRADLELVVAQRGVNLSPAVTADTPASADGGRFRVSVRNSGGEPATGPTVLHLPGLRAGTGDGWVCLPPAEACTTTRSLPPGADLPELAVQVPCLAERALGDARGTGPAPSRRRARGRHSLAGRPRRDRPA